MTAIMENVDTKVLFHCTLVSNVKSIMKEGLIPKVGALSEKMDEEAGVFLFPSYDDCENALMNWLGMEYDELEIEDEEIVVLKVELPMDFPLEESVEWERVSRKAIEPKHLSFYSNGEHSDYLNRAIVARNILS